MTRPNDQTKYTKNLSGLRAGHDRPKDQANTKTRFALPHMTRPLYVVFINFIYLFILLAFRERKHMRVFSLTVGMHREDRTVEQSHVRQRKPLFGIGETVQLLFNRTVFSVHAYSHRKYVHMFTLTKYFYFIL